MLSHDHADPDVPNAACGFEASAASDQRQIAGDDDRLKQPHVLDGLHEVGQVAEVGAGAFADSDLFDADQLRSRHWFLAISHRPV